MSDEKQFELNVMKTLQECGLAVVQDVYIGGLINSQIDLIAIGEQGIFCIEVKRTCAHHIIVKGLEDFRYIKSKYNNYGYEWFKEGYNPLKQNSIHVGNLVNFIKDNKVSDYCPRVYNIVVMGNFDKITADYPLDNMCITHIKELKEYIRSVESSYLTKEEIKDYWLLILSKSDTSEDRLNKHKEYLLRCKKMGLGAWAQECRDEVMSYYFSYENYVIHEQFKRGGF